MTNLPGVLREPGERSVLERAVRVAEALYEVAGEAYAVLLHGREVGRRDAANRGERGERSGRDAAEVEEAGEVQLEVGGDADEVCVPAELHRVVACDPANVVGVLIAILRAYDGREKFATDEGYAGDVVGRALPVLRGEGCAALRELEARLVDDRVRERRGQRRDERRVAQRLSARA